MVNIDKLALIYFKEGKILSSRSKGKKLYYLPGGKRENNETDIQTLVREIKEELSVDILEDTIQFYGCFSAQADGKEDGVNVKMTCYQAEFKGQLEADHEIDEIVWLSYSDIDKVSEVDKLIFKDAYAKGLFI